MKAQLPKRIYVRTLAAQKCKCGSGLQPLSFGEYITGKFRSIEHSCSQCISLAPSVRAYKLEHKRDVNLVCTSQPPEWLCEFSREAAIPIVRI